MKEMSASVWSSLFNEIIFLFDRLPSSSISLISDESLLPGLAILIHISQPTASK